MAVRELSVFKHSKEWGDCPAYKLFDAVEVKRNDDVEYARKYRDYSVAVYEEQIPETAEAGEEGHNPYLAEKRGDVIVSRGMPVFSRSLGASGVCDGKCPRKCGVEEKAIRGVRRAGVKCWDCQELYSGEGV